ncbi:hypothetical protein DPMN_056659 [Dreissena polymorpha]|uniref:Uncharacterized protein n=1 Tax=Dreissena polymorpha TaxID=45954 RepID=A0A9D4CS44_DREPO|nr:hypothetical protein DPMN_056659 [Dreissena polymorpha]
MRWVSLSCVIDVRYVFRRLMAEKDLSLSSSSCPRSAMPWRAMNRMLRRMCSSCFRFSAFSLACPADSVSPTSRVVAGSVTSRSTASLWQSLPSSGTSRDPVSSWRSRH